MLALQGVSRLCTATPPGPQGANQGFLILRTHERGGGGFAGFLLMILVLKSTPRARRFTSHIRFVIIPLSFATFELNAHVNA